MSKTVEDLVKVYIEAFDAMKALEDWPNDSFPDGTCERAGIAAVIRAVRPKLALWFHAIDQNVTEKTAAKFADDFICEILGSDAGEKVAGSTPEGTVLSSSAEGEPPASPATDPAPAPCLWRVHHETRNGPLYVSQCDGEWRHAAADPKCPSCKKTIFFVTDAAHAVCEWRSNEYEGAYSPGCETPAVWYSDGSETPQKEGYNFCPSCGKPIKFTEAKA